MTQEPKDRRSESRNILDEYYSVEFSIRDVGFVYQFKIWNVSSKGLCLVVREDSEVLRHLKVGDMVRMKYYRADTLRTSEYLNTHVIHITKDKTGRFKGHFLVGISVSEDRKTDP
jgi:hypothetical protein